MIVSMVRRIGIILLCFFLSACSKSYKASYTIGVDPSWYPLELLGREKAVFLFTNDLLEEISVLRNVEISRMNRSWDNLYPGLMEEKYQAISSSLQPYVFYENRYDFSEIYLETGPVLVLPKTSSVNSIEKMNGRQIAVQEGSSAATLTEKYPKIIIRFYPSIPQALQDVQEGIIDGAVVDLLAAEAYTRDIFKGLKIATDPLLSEGLRLIALQGKVPELIEDFNAGLQALKKSGRYDELLKKWNLGNNL